MSYQPPSPPQYGAMPPAGMPGPISRPPSMNTAVLLMRIGAGLSVVSMIINLVTLQAVKDQVRSMYPSYDSVQVDQTVALLIPMTVFTGLVGTGLWIWMSITNGNGRSWARVVASVFFGLCAFFTLLNFFNQGLLVSKLFALAILGVGGTALYYMYRPDSSRYYQAMSQPNYQR